MYVLLHLFNSHSGILAEDRKRDEWLKSNSHSMTSQSMELLMTATFKNIKFAIDTLKEDLKHWAAKVKRLSSPIISIRLKFEHDPITFNNSLSLHYSIWLLGSSEPCNIGKTQRILPGYRCTSTSSRTKTSLIIYPTAAIKSTVRVEP